MHQRKVLTAVWWSATGIIHYIFVDSGDMIIGWKYCNDIDIVTRKPQHVHPTSVSWKYLLFHTTTSDWTSHNQYFSPLTVARLLLFWMWNFYQTLKTFWCSVIWWLSLINYGKVLAYSEQCNARSGSRFWKLVFKSSIVIIVHIKKIVHLKDALNNM